MGRWPDYRLSVGNQRTTGLEVFDSLRQCLHPPLLRRERIPWRAKTVRTAGGRTQAVLIEQAPHAGKDHSTHRNDDGNSDDDNHERFLLGIELDAPHGRPRQVAADAGYSWK